MIDIDKEPQRYALLAGAIGPTVYGGDWVKYEDYAALIAEVRALREAPSESDILRALHTWFSPDHPDQNDFVARMRKAIDAARGAK